MNISSIDRRKVLEMIQRFGLFFVIILMVLLMRFVLEPIIIPDRPPVFLTGGNIVNVLRQVSMNGIMAVGITFVILTGGIDLSIGAIVAVTSVIAGYHLDHGGTWQMAFALGMTGALIFGITNGILIAVGGLPPFIATLATQAIARGFALVYSNGRPYLILDDKFLNIGKGSSLGIPNPIWLLLTVCLLAYIVLTFTVFGRHVYAFGGNRQAAKLAGVRIKLVEIAVYVIAGVLAGLTAIILTARISSGQPTAGQGYELDAIAAAAIGGTSMIGGSGTVGGTIMGFIIIGIMINSMTLLGVSSYYQQIVKGFIIIAAVMLDMVIKRRGK
ncbi:MAG: ABC transporter permease [Treponema sp.]|jgi:ribose/xylose/arabinose/galactoside ABC-type transport system permease subunit|nr:ABC transporter permease [Treponema sp.]